MKKISPLLSAALVLAVIFAALHFLALALHLYWIYWWYDWIMHFLAGVTGGFAAYGVLHRLELISRGKFKGIFSAPVLSVVISMMIVGVAWELMEYVADITDSHEGYPLDPAIDLTLDGLGALLAVVVGKRIVNKND